jgi:thiol-disulfide isomerase/thioredoxin
MNILLDKRVITRKSHHCWGCTKEYPAKTPMQIITNTDRGRIFTSYWCQICMDFMETLEAYQKEDGFDYGDLLNFEDFPKAEVSSESTH